MSGQLIPDQPARRTATIEEFYGLPNGSFQKYIEKERAKAQADEIKRRQRIAAARKARAN